MLHIVFARIDLEDKKVTKVIISKIIGIISLSGDGNIGPYCRNICISKIFLIKK